MSFKKNDEGFTGLEAAIVLIAFVVVAAVFSYVVLGAGFFTTQKAQQTVHTGVQETTSAVEPSGPVSVHTADGTSVDSITFYLQLAAGGTGVDMSKVTYAVSTANAIATIDNSDAALTWVQDKSEGDHSGTTGTLSSGEMVLVTIDPATITPAITIGTNTQFTVEVRPPVGAALPITRTVPGSIATGNWYEVY